MQKKILILIGILPLLGFSIRPGLVPADTAFDHLLSKEQKGNVTELKGGALTYQGYSAYLKFTASKEFLEHLELQKKPQVNLEELRNRLRKENRSLSDYFQSRFRMSESAIERIISLQGEWKPEEVSNPLLYEIPFDALKNEWTHGGEELILIDQSTSTTYYKSSGA